MAGARWTTGRPPGRWSASSRRARGAVCAAATAARLSAQQSNETRHRFRVRGFGTRSFLSSTVLFCREVFSVTYENLCEIGKYSSMRSPPPRPRNARRVSEDRCAVRVATYPQPTLATRRARPASQPRHDRARPYACMHGSGWYIHVCNAWVATDWPASTSSLLTGSP